MSGAFGAVGGDVSAMNINPAGSAIFNYNTGTGSITSYNMSNQSNLFGTRTKQRDNSFDLNQLGAVFVFNSANEAATMRKFTLGFNYENTNNFDNSTFTAGINQRNTAADYFLRYANGIGNEGGITLDALENSSFQDLSYIDQQAYLGYNGYVFNPVSTDGTNSVYTSNIPSANNYQELYVDTRGYNAKVALNFAAQFKSWLYVGANLNVHFTDLIKTTSFYEEYTGPADSGLQALRFNNERYTYGGGFSFNLGVIAKVTEDFRVGLAYESPTWYRLQDELRQSISVGCPDCGTAGNTITTDPGVTMIIDDYSLQTPAKYTGSAAYIIAKQGLISIDYSLKDYSTTQFTNSGYTMINNELSNNLVAASEVRIGAEWRIKAFSMRGGYRFEQSPYKNGNTMGDLTGFSGGLGFAFGNQRLDLAYSYFKRTMETPMLTAGFANDAHIRNVNNNVTLSYTIDL
ncbi:MAG: transporter [Flavobacterium sp.]|nr:MAG: transporter [Flavobacterium sp.]